MLDAASYVKDAWDSVSQTSIKNAFVKAKLMNLEPELEAGNDVDVIMSYLHAFFTFSRECDM
jgi:hypothetical protein